MCVRQVAYGAVATAKEACFRACHLCPLSHCYQTIHQGVEMIDVEKGKEEQVPNAGVVTLLAQLANYLPHIV